jgi:ABC-type thiamine transport system substrate-binding protein
VETSKLEVNLVDVQETTILVNELMKTGLELGTDVIVGILLLC